jgi:hypothetical protein
MLPGNASLAVPKAAFLKHPGVAVRVGEVGEACVVTAIRVRPWTKALSGARWRLVPDLADRHRALEQRRPSALEVSDD